MKKSLFYIGLLAIGAFLATLAVRKHSTLNHNQVPAMAEVQLTSETTTTTSEEPAPVAQVQEDSTTNVVEITFQPRFHVRNQSSR